MGKKQLDLFGLQKPTKVERFKQDLREKIISRVLVTNKDVYDYTLEQGHIPLHAKEEVKRMKKEGLVDFNISPMINYEQVYKKQNIISYMIK